MTLSGIKIIETTAKNAGELTPRDRIANLGRVVRATPVGAFVIVQTERRNWSLATGLPTHSSTDTVFHMSDEVLILAGERE